MTYSTIKNLKISKIIPGTVQLGLSYGIANKTGMPSKAESFSILKAAFEAGINTLDTASAYGQSETLIGEYMEQENERFNIITKFALSDKSLTNHSEAFEEAKAQILASKKKMNGSPISFFLFHKLHAQPMNLVMLTLPRLLRALKDQNLIERGGISVHHPSDLLLLVDEPSVEAIEVPVNIFNHVLFAPGILRQMKENEKFIFARSIYLQGLFFMDKETLPPGVSAAAPYLDRLRKIAGFDKKEIARLALTFVRDLEGVTSLILGTETKSQLEENLELLKSPAISLETRIDLSKQFRNIPENIFVPSLWKI